MCTTHSLRTYCSVLTLGAASRTDGYGVCSPAAEAALCFLVRGDGRCDRLSRLFRHFSPLNWKELARWKGFIGEGGGDGKRRGARRHKFQGAVIFWGVERKGGGREEGGVFRRRSQFRAGFCLHDGLEPGFVWWTRRIDGASASAVFFSVSEKRPPPPCLLFPISRLVFYLFLFFFAAWIGVHMFLLRI